jgi:hypothetical protein
MRRSRQSYLYIAKVMLDFYPIIINIFRSIPFGKQRILIALDYLSIAAYVIKMCCEIIDLSFSLSQVVFRKCERRCTGVIPIFRVCSLAGSTLHLSCVFFSRDPRLLPPFCHLHYYRNVFAMAMRS